MKYIYCIVQIYCCQISLRFHECVMNQHELDIQHSLYVERRSVFLKRQRAEMISLQLYRPTPFVHAESH